MTTMPLRPDPRRPASRPFVPPRGPAPLTPEALAAKARAAPWAIGSFILGLAAIVLTWLSDPYWLALPTSLAAMAVAFVVHRKISDNHPASHFGFAMGFVGLFLWFVIDVALGLVAGIDFKPSMLLQR